MLNTRGERNNNPGNIRLDPDTTWQGQVEGEDADFCTFDTAENGIRALAKVLLAYQTKHDLHTVRDMIDRWAPPSENDSTAYVDDVAGHMAVAPDDEIDLTNPHLLVAMVGAVIRHENGEQPYDGGLLLAAAHEALGEEPVADVPNTTNEGETDETTA